MRKKWTLAGKLGCMMLLIILGTILANLIINETMLEKYYTYNKSENLEDGFFELQDVCRSDSYSQEKFEKAFWELCAENDFSMMAWNESNGLWYSSSTNLEELKYQLDSIKYNANSKEDKDVLVKEGRYIISKQKDTRSQVEYLVLSGLISDGTYVYMRSPLESIRESVKITTRFFLMVELVTLLISFLVIAFISRGVAKPIRNLSEISQRMTRLDFEAKYIGKRYATKEVEQLGNSMNELSQTLETTISELKTANLKLQKDIAQREELDGIRKEFLSNVSHELKTPLALISGYAEGLKEGISDDPESIQFYCDVICDETNKMNEMVKKLLSLNQLEFDNKMIEMKRFDITELVRGKIMSYELIARQKELHFEFEEESCQVWGDEFWIEEVIGNYISNAINHAEGEKIIRIRYEKNENTLRLHVFNTGKEIPSEDIAFIWDKFYKVDKARSREYGGNGIGLSIVKAIMERHRQEYGVENCGNGVDFWFELELVEKARKS